MLYSLSTPLVGNILIYGVEHIHHRDAAVQPSAIVVLSGDVARSPGSVKNDAVGAMTLARARVAADLYRETGLPILVTGGVVGRSDASVGLMMKESLESDFGVPVRWLENRALNTRENAGYSAALLDAAGIREVYLVTHAFHVGRSLCEFEKFGVRSKAVGVNPSTLDDMLQPTIFFPSVRAYAESYFAFHEVLGMLRCMVSGREPHPALRP